MRVAQIGDAGVFRYSEGLRENTVNKSKEIDIDYTFVGPAPLIGPALNLPISTLFKDFRGYDIVHNLSSYPFFPMRRGKGVLVTSAHEMQPVLYPELTKARLHSFKDWIWEVGVSQLGLKCLLSSDYVLANSKQSAEGVAKAGFPKKRIFVTPHGLDRRFLSGIGKARSRRFRVGFVGTLGPQKNVSFAINAFKRVSGKDLEMELWGKNIYSDEELRGWIGSDARIRLMGQAPDSNIINIYDSFNAFVFPSLFEGFGLPIIEAKARGLPVIVWKEGHLSEEVRRYCFLAKDEEDMADIILSIKENGYNEKLRRRAMADARKYTWERTAKETIEAYKKMI